MGQWLGLIAIVCDKYEKKSITGLTGAVRGVNCTSSMGGAKRTFVGTSAQFVKR